MRLRAPYLSPGHVFALGLGLALGGAGCAAILGFDDTTLRSTDVNDEGGMLDSGLGDAPSDSPITADGSPSRLGTSPTSLLVRRGSSTDVTVDIERGSDVTGTVTAKLSDLPPGVTATAATLVPPATAGKLTVTAAKGAALGSATVQLTADSTSLPVVAVPLVVADPAGALDVTFGLGGVAVDGTRGLGETFYALALQADAKIVAGGIGSPGTPGWVLRRFTMAGVVESGFAPLLALPADGELHGIAIDPTGKFVCVGSSMGMAGTTVLTVVRLLSTGAFDTGFNGTGILRLAGAETGMSSIGLGVAIQPDKSIVVVGSRQDTLTTGSGLIARFTEAGLHDPKFNGGAVLALPGTRLVGVSVESTGSIVASGSMTTGSGSFYITRRTTSGGPDLTYGTSGATSFGAQYQANGSARLSSGTVAFAGSFAAGDGYNAGAANDKGVGLFQRSFGTAAGAVFYGVAGQDDTRFIAAGHTAVTSGEARVMRIGTGGVPDPSFGTGGVVIIEPAGVAGNGFDVTLFSAAVQADGRIVVAGNRTSSGGVLYRLWQ